MAALGRAGFEPALARYLLWRLGSTLNFSSPSATAISLLLLGCELMLLLSGFLPLWFSLARQRPLKPQPLHRFPAVDLLLPSCGEPLEVVRRSLQGCAAIHYPALTVWLLDDSDRLNCASSLPSWAAAIWPAAATPMPKRAT